MQPFNVKNFSQNHLYNLNTLVKLEEKIYNVNLFINSLKK
jgi:hypothetical protein